MQLSKWRKSKKFWWKKMKNIRTCLQNIKFRVPFRHIPSPPLHFVSTSFCISLRMTPFRLPIEAVHQTTHLPDWITWFLPHQYFWYSYDSLSIDNITRINRWIEREIFTFGDLAPFFNHQMCYTVSPTIPEITGTVSIYIRNALNPKP